MTKFSSILYKAGNLPNSVIAQANLTSMCLATFAGNYKIEIVDILEDPQRGLDNGILVTPTLIKLSPEPKQIIWGTLSDIPRLLSSLGWVGAPD